MAIIVKCKSCGKDYKVSFLGWQNYDMCEECFKKGAVAVQSIHENRSVYDNKPDGTGGILLVMGIAVLCVALLIGVALSLCGTFLKTNRK